MITEQTFTEVAYVRHWEQSAIHLARGLCCRGGACHAIAGRQALSCTKDRVITPVRVGVLRSLCPKSTQMAWPRCAYSGLSCWAHERFPPPTSRPMPSDVSLSLFLSCFGPKMVKPSKVELLIKSDSSTVMVAHPRPDGAWSTTRHKFVPREAYHDRVQQVCLVTAIAKFQNRAQKVTTVLAQDHCFSDDLSE